MDEIETVLYTMNHGAMLRDHSIVYSHVILMNISYR